MKRFPLLAIILMISSYGFIQAQTKGSCTNVVSTAIAKQNNKEDLKAYYQNYQSNIGSEFDGTYQFIISGNEKLLVTSEILDFISQNRDQNKEVVLDLTTNIKVRILPGHNIKSKKFSLIPIKEMFIISTQLISK